MIPFIIIAALLYAVRIFFGKDVALIIIFVGAFFGLIELFFRRYKITIKW